MIRIYFPPNDTDRIMDIWLNGNKQAHCFIPGSYWESCAQEVQSLLSQADVFVWEEEGLIKGFAGMQGNYLAGIFVDTAGRTHHHSGRDGRGHGARGIYVDLEPTGRIKHCRKPSRNPPPPCQSVQSVILCLYFLGRVL